MTAERLFVFLFSTVAFLVLLSTTAEAQNQYLQPGESAVHVQGGYAIAAVGGGGAAGGDVLAGGLSGSYEGLVSFRGQYGRVYFQDGDENETARALSGALGLMLLRQDEATPFNFEMGLVYERVRFQDHSFFADDDDYAHFNSLSIGVFGSRRFDETAPWLLIPEVGLLYTPLLSRGSIDRELTGQVAVGIGIEAQEHFLVTLEPSLEYGTQAEELTASVALGFLGLW